MSILADTMQALESARAYSKRVAPFGVYKHRRKLNPRIELFAGQQWTLDDHEILIRVRNGSSETVGVCGVSLRFLALAPKTGKYTHDLSDAAQVSFEQPRRLEPSESLDVKASEVDLLIGASDVLGIPYPACGLCWISVTNDCFRVHEKGMPMMVPRLTPRRRWLKEIQNQLLFEDGSLPLPPLEYRRIS